MRIYLACALTHVPRDHFDNYVASIHQLASSLSVARSHEVKYALVDSDPQLATKPDEERARLCYLWDCKMVQEADLIVAECSYPSIGLGIELQMAAAHDKPVIILFRESDETRARPVKYLNPDSTEHDLQIGSGVVSLMALGIPTLFRVHRYTSMPEAVEALKKSLLLIEQR